MPEKKGSIPENGPEVNTTGSKSLEKLNKLLVKLTEMGEMKNGSLKRLNSILIQITLLLSFFTAGVAVGRREILAPYIEAKIQEIQSLLDEHKTDEQGKTDEIPSHSSLTFTETTIERLQSLLNDNPEEAFIEQRIDELCKENRVPCSFEEPSTNELLSVVVYKDFIEGGSPRYRMYMRDETRHATYTISFSEEDGRFYVDDSDLYLEDDTLLTLVELAKHLKESGFSTFKLPMRVHDIILKSYYQKTILDTPSKNGPISSTTGHAGSYFPEYQVVIQTSSGEKVYIVTPDDWVTPNYDEGPGERFTKRPKEIVRQQNLIEKWEQDFK